MPESAFDELSIVSDDLDATVKFYRRLGLPMDEPARTGEGSPFHASSRGPEGASLEASSCEFARFWNKGWANEANLNGRVLISVRVASRPEVDKLYEEVTAVGHRGLQAPLDAFWGARFAIVEDPNGLAVGLMSPADDAHHAPLNWP